MRKKIGKAIFYSVIIVLAAQLSMNLFIADFKISLAVICFSVFLFLTEDFPLIPVTCLSSVGVCAARLLFYWVQYGSSSGISSYMPEMCFYICYGFLLYLYTKLYHSYVSNKNAAFFALIIIDYTANFVELFVRMGTYSFTARTQAGIFIVACLRSLIIWLILAIFERYRFLLLQHEHEERYKRLLLLISKLNSEVVWMNKNASMIEDTMNTSYRLFEQLKNSGAGQELTTAALSVARDIHEIKKEYLLIVRGISEALDQEFQSDGMHLHELLSLLQDSISLMAKEQGKELSLTYKLQKTFYTDKHYALMSVFRNLFINALEASKENTVKIYVEQTEADGFYIFDVTDSGPGIPGEYIDEVFKTGFSTKINYTTGEVSRGLGLNLVQDLVEEQFHGTISLDSVPGRTTFSIRIPINQIEVVTQ